MDPPGTGETQMTYTLTFWGGIKRKYRRTYETFADAEQAARPILNTSNRNAHPAIIYGPGCGSSGRTIT